jgi:hypothetical protein
MPDLTIEYHYHCETAEDWSLEIKGKHGTYTVSWGRNWDRIGDVEYDYSCTCQGFKFRKTCSHIKEVKEKKLRCGWMGFTDGGKTVMKNGKAFCPKCGAEAHPLAYGV